MSKTARTWVSTPGGVGLAILALLWAAPAWGQTRVSTGGSGFGSTGSSFGNSGFGGGGFGSSGFGGGFGGSGLGGLSFGNSFGTASMGGNSFGAGFSGGGSPFGIGFGSPIGSSLQQGSFRPASGTSGFNTAVPVNVSNPFAAYYGNPLAAGLVSGTSRQMAFGTPIFGTTSNVTGTFSSTGLPAQTPLTLSPNPARRSVPYVFTTGFPAQHASGSRLADELRDVIARSTSLSSKDSIRVSVEGQVAVLRGTVSDDHDRRLAEGLIRLSPGVHGVRNELRVRGSTITADSRRD